MIPPVVVDQIKRLLAEGSLSQRKIARLKGVSRTSVSAIASGRRPDYAARAPDREAESAEPDGPPQRCPGCGGMVFMPCRLCDARRRMDGSRTTRFALVPDVPLEIDLVGDDRVRYERIHFRRMREDPRFFDE